MVFVLLNDEIILHGGTADNYIFNDMWYYNITNNRWFQKSTFVYPNYPVDLQRFMYLILYAYFMHT